jgi:hypothetical protein
LKQIDEIKAKADQQKKLEGEEDLRKELAALGL